MIIQVCLIITDQFLYLFSRSSAQIQDLSNVVNFCVEDNDIDDNDKKV